LNENNGQGNQGQILDFWCGFHNGENCGWIALTNVIIVGDIKKTKLQSDKILRNFSPVMNLDINDSDFLAKRRGIA
jgi:hypothetical protein